MDAQLKKGFLEFCVLASIKNKDSYGYQIVKDVSQYIEISESTLYPILRRLESSQSVMTYTEEHKNRLRKERIIAFNAPRLFSSSKYKALPILLSITVLKSE